MTSRNYVSDLVQESLERCRRIYGTKLRSKSQSRLRKKIDSQPRYRTLSLHSISSAYSTRGKSPDTSQLNLSMQDFRFGLDSLKLPYRTHHLNLPKRNQSITKSSCIELVSRKTQDRRSFGMLSDTSYPSASTDYVCIATSNTEGDARSLECRYVRLQESNHSLNLSYFPQPGNFLLKSAETVGSSVTLSEAELSSPSGVFEPLIPPSEGMISSRVCEGEFHPFFDSHLGYFNGPENSLKDPTNLEIGPPRKPSVTGVHIVEGDDKKRLSRAKWDGDTDDNPSEGRSKQRTQSYVGGGSSDQSGSVDTTPSEGGFKLLAPERSGNRNSVIPQVAGLPIYESPAQRLLSEPHTQVKKDGGLKAEKGRWISMERHEEEGEKAKPSVESGHTSRKDGPDFPESRRSLAEIDTLILPERTPLQVVTTVSLTVECDEQRGFQTEIPDVTELPVSVTPGANTKARFSPRRVDSEDHHRQQSRTEESESALFWSEPDVVQFDAVESKRIKGSPIDRIGQISKCDSPSIEDTQVQRSALMQCGELPRAASDLMQDLQPNQTSESGEYCPTSEILSVSSLSTNNLQISDEKEDRLHDQYSISTKNTADKNQPCVPSEHSVEATSARICGNFPGFVVNESEPALIDHAKEALPSSAAVLSQRGKLSVGLETGLVAELVDTHWSSNEEPRSSTDLPRNSSLAPLFGCTGGKYRWFQRWLCACFCMPLAVGQLFTIAVDERPCIGGLGPEGCTVAFLTMTSMPIGGAGCLAPAYVAPLLVKKFNGKEAKSMPEFCAKAILCNSCFIVQMHSWAELLQTKGQSPPRQQRMDH